MGWLAAGGAVVEIEAGIGAGMGVAVDIGAGTGLDVGVRVVVGLPLASATHAAGALVPFAFELVTVEVA